MIDDLGRIRAVVDDVDLHFSRLMAGSGSGVLLHSLRLRVQTVGERRVPFFQLGQRREVHHQVLDNVMEAVMRAL